MLVVATIEVVHLNHVTFSKPTPLISQKRKKEKKKQPYPLMAVLVAKRSKVLETREPCIRICENIVAELETREPSPVARANLVVPSNSFLL